MIKIKCKICKSWFENYPSNHRKFCSNKCRAQFQKTKTGKQSAVYRHGMSNTPFHNKWLSMIQRCTDKKHHKFPIYGGRGIVISPEWLVFENFYKDMHSSYLIHLKKYGAKQTTLERIDTNGNYSLENCKWATIVEQANNRRRSIRYTYKGKTLNLKQWAKILGIKYGTLYRRITVAKLPFKKAIKK